MRDDDMEYAGFWPRVGAALIDGLLLVVITAPLLLAVYGRHYFDEGRATLLAGPMDFVISYAFPMVATVAFWLRRQATPGKMAIGARVVDATTGGAVSVEKAIWRYLTYFVSAFPLGLGLLWVAFDPKKQGWHDKLAGTVVVRSKSRVAEAVRFDRR